MPATPARLIPIDIPAAWRPLLATALLLERLDRMPRAASAAQYRSVAQRASTLLEQAQPGPVLNQLLQAFPSLAELWENRHYGTSGLCRSPLEPALKAELATAALLEKLRT